MSGQKTIGMRRLMDPEDALMPQYEPGRDSAGSACCLKAPVNHISILCAWETFCMILFYREIHPAL